MDGESKADFILKEYICGTPTWRVIDVCLNAAYKDATKPMAAMSRFAASEFIAHRWERAAAPGCIASNCRTQLQHKRKNDWATAKTKAYRAMEFIDIFF